MRCGGKQSVDESVGADQGLTLTTTNHHDFSTSWDVLYATFEHLNRPRTHERARTTAHDPRWTLRQLPSPSPCARSRHGTPAPAERSTFQKLTPCTQPAINYGLPPLPARAPSSTLTRRTSHRRGHRVQRRPARPRHHSPARANLALPLARDPAVTLAVAVGPGRPRAQIGRAHV